MTSLTGAIWRKSSRSAQSNECVEVALNLVDANWHKSSRSSSSNECVEVARNLPGVVGVRDSKNLAGPALVIEPTAWSTFTNDVKVGNCGL